jgi:Flp pilus assembly protein TadG
MSLTAVQRPEGQASILMALLLPVLLGMVGLALDSGQTTIKFRQSQNGADAAALAAAVKVQQGSSEASATSLANLVVQQDGILASQLTLTYLDSSGSATSSSSLVASVRAQVQRNFSTLFMGVLGVNNSSVTATAKATLNRRAPCVVCTLDPSAPSALTASGNGTLTVTGGGVIVNSSASPAASLSGNGSISASSIGVVGTTSNSGSGSFSPTPTTGISPIPDPLASVPVPSVTGPVFGAYTLSSGSATISPGIYDSITISGTGTLTLSPGIYVLKGGAAVHGNGSLVANGVMLYFACSSYPTPCTSGGQAGGLLNLSGNGTFAVTAPTSGPYQGLSVFYDRNNNSPLWLTGNGSDNLTGTIYAKSSTYNLSGNGTTMPSNSMIVTAQLSMSGNGGVSISYTQSQNYSTTSLPNLTQ